MIVNIESIQAKFVSEYKLGIVLKPSDQLNEKLQTYITEFNEEEFENGCLKMLEKIRNDIADFENKIIGLIS
jgi:type IV secretory pathway VirB4 component